jgi:hypothetical protein
MTDSRGTTFEQRDTEYKYHAFIQDRFNADKEWHIYSNDKQEINVVQVMDGKITGDTNAGIEMYNEILGVRLQNKLEPVKYCFECDAGDHEYRTIADYLITGYNYDDSVPVRGHVCMDCLNLYDDHSKTIKSMKPISYAAKVSDTRVGVWGSRGVDKATLK